MNIGILERPHINGDVLSIAQLTRCPVFPQWEVAGSKCPALTLVCRSVDRWTDR